MKQIFFALAFCLVSINTNAQEKITLSTPVFTDAGAAVFRPESIYMKRQIDNPVGGEIESPAVIRAIFRELDGNDRMLPNGRTLECNYNGPIAQTHIATINTGNNSSVSMERKIWIQCQADKKLPAGTISGTPQ